MGLNDMTDKKSQIKYWDSRALEISHMYFACLCVRCGTNHHCTGDAYGDNMQQCTSCREREENKYIVLYAKVKPKPWRFHMIVRVSDGKIFKWRGYILKEALKKYFDEEEPRWYMYVRAEFGRRRLSPILQLEELVTLSEAS